MTSAEADRDSVLNGAAAYLMEKLQQRGIAVQPVLTDSGRALQVAGQGMLSMENIADDLVAVSPSQWEERLQQWLNMVVNAVNSATGAALSRDEIMSMIRTRLVSAAEAADHTYARRFTEDLSVVLCLDFPTHVEKLSDAGIATLQIPLEALFAQGQKNTNVEPIEETFDEDGVHFLGGDSMFIASKAAEMSTLLSQIGVSAPDGLLFAVPNRSLLAYRVPTVGDGVADLMGMALMLSRLRPESGFDNPGGVLSSNIYYWATDGTIEPQSGDFAETMAHVARIDATVNMPEDETVVLRPGRIFFQRFITG